MCPWGLSPEDTQVISSVSLSGRGPRRKRKLCCSTSREKALYIYFNEDWGDVNKSPLPLLLSIHPTVYPSLSNPGCECFPLHCPPVPISAVHGLDIVIHLRCQTRERMFFRLFCLMSCEDRNLALALWFLNRLCLVDTKPLSRILEVNCEIE